MQPQVAHRVGAMRVREQGYVEEPADPVCHWLVYWTWPINAQPVVEVPFQLPSPTNPPCQGEQIGVHGSVGREKVGSLTFREWEAQLRAAHGE